MRQRTGPWLPHCDPKRRNLGGKVDALIEQICELKSLRRYSDAAKSCTRLSAVQIEGLLDKELMISMLAPPELFLTESEGDDYVEYLAQFMRSVRDLCLAEPNKSTSLAKAVIEQAQFRSTTHSYSNLKSLMSLRADLFGIALSDYAQIRDFAFQPRPAKKQKIKFGVILQSMLEDPETLAALSYFEHAPDERFQTTVYLLTDHADPEFEERVRHASDKLVSLPQNLRGALELIRADDLDIVFFANDVTAKPSLKAQLSFFRLARFAFTCVSSIATTCSPFVTHYFGARYFQSQQLADEYSERYVSLEFPGFCFSESRQVQGGTGDNVLQLCDIPDGVVKLSSGANFTKLHLPLLSCWAAIMERRPETVLLLAPFPPHYGGPRKHLISTWRSVFETFGVAQERVIIFESRGTPEGFRSLLANADIYLDSFPYSGLTTVVDALKAALPTVTLAGPYLRNNHASAILADIDTPFGISDSIAAYMEKAIVLIDNPAMRSALSEAIALKMKKGVGFLDPKAFCSAVSNEIEKICLGVNFDEQGASSEKGVDEGWEKIIRTYVQGDLKNALSLASALCLGAPSAKLAQLIHQIRAELILNKQLTSQSEMLTQLQRVAKSVHQNFVIQLQHGEQFSNPKRLEKYGYCIASQNEEDGMLAEVFRRIGVADKTFFEFGVGNGLQSITTALLLQGWRGWWIEIHPQKFQFIKHYFREAVNSGRLTVVDTMVNRENIESITEELGIPDEIDLLSIDIDGNDYHVFKALERVRPRVAVLEYNGIFPPPIEKVAAYDPSYEYAPHTYVGASLQSLVKMANRKGYRLVGCNISGLNCIFVRSDLAQDHFVSPATAENLYNPPRYQLAWGGAFNDGPTANYSASDADENDSTS